MSTTENKNPAAPKNGLTLREQERERTACREWLSENGGDKMSAAEREVAEKSWLFRAEQQKKKPFLTDEERASILKMETADKIAYRLSHELGYSVAHDDPLITASLSGIALHESILNRHTTIIDRLIERMERYEINIQEAEKLMSTYSKIAIAIQAELNKTENHIKAYNENAAKLANNHGQILKVGGNGGNPKDTVKAAAVIGISIIIAAAIIAGLVYIIK